MTRDQLRAAIKNIQPKHGKGYAVRVYFNGFTIDGDIQEPTATLLTVTSRGSAPTTAISIESIDAIAMIT